MKHLKKCFLLLISGFLLSGCWDRLEIEDRATVLGLSIDLAEESKIDDPINHPDDEDIPTSELGMVEITAQLAVPGQIPLGPSQGGGGSGPLDTVWVVESVGHTVSDAINNLQQQLASTLFLGHLKIVIISKDVAEKGVSDIVDFMKRHPEIRRDAWLLVNGKKAKETLEVAPKLERVPTMYLSNMLDNSIKMGKFPKVKVGKFWIALENDGEDGYLPYITVKGKEHIQLDGIAYFKDDKMVGHTKPYQIAYINGLTEQNPGGSTAVVKLSADQSVMFQSTKRKSDYKVTLQDGKPKFIVNVEIVGNIAGKSTATLDINSEETLKQIEKKAEELLKIEFEKLIDETQEKESDIFGFGEYVRAKLRHYWDHEVKNADAWRKVYKDLPIELVVKVKIAGVGLKSK